MSTSKHDDNKESAVLGSSQTNRSQQPSVRLRPKVVSAIVFTCGMVLVLFMTWSQHESQRQSQQLEFERRASREIYSIRSQFEQMTIQLQSVAGFVVSHPDLKREQFHQFVGPILERNEGLQAVEWIPRVQHAPRKQYERAAIENGLNSFRFTERNDEGELVAARNRPEYYPVYFVEPLEGNEAALGFDLASNPLRLEALNRSGSTGQPVATAGIRLVQESGDSYGFLVFVPVYQPWTESENEIDLVQKRKDSLLGFALGVYRVQAMHDAALGGVGEAVAHFQITDVTDATPVQLLTDAAFKANADAPRSYHEEHLRLAGRQWKITCVATDRFNESSARDSGIWTAIVIGFIVVLLVSILTHQIGQHRLGLRNLVDTQARELDAKTGELATLVQELECQNFAMNQHIILSVTDIRGTIITVNDKFCSIAGYTEEELLGQNHSIVKSDFHSDEFFREMWLTISQGRVWTGEIQNKAKDGSPYWVHSTIVPLRNVEGKIDRYLAARTDITLFKELQTLSDERNVALEEVLEDVEATNALMNNRELRMIELKREINLLCDQCNEIPRYDMSELAESAFPV